MVLEWNCTYASTRGKKKKTTGVSCQCDVTSKFNPAWVPPPSHCVTSAPRGPCWHPWPLACWWLTGSPPTIFPKLTFSLLLPHTPSLRCSGFWETQAFYSFLSRRNTGMIYCVFQMNSTWCKLIEHTLELGSKKRQFIEEQHGKHSSQFELVSVVIWETGFAFSLSFSESIAV